MSLTPVTKESDDRSQQVFLFGGDMERFLIELNRILGQWPEQARWSVAQIASYTGAAPAQVMEWLSFALGRELDLTDRLTLEDGERARDVLEDAKDRGLHVRSDVGVSEDAEARYVKLVERCRELAREKDWRRGYKNFANFLAKELERLPFSSRIEAIGECLRFGTKAEEAPQELLQWLKRGVEEATADGTRQGTEEALDLIDAYGDAFVENGKSPALEALFQSLAELVAKYDLGERVEEIRDELSLS